jgi:hypothetical protein
MNMGELSERERCIASAAYLKGLIVGLSTNRSDAYRKKAAVSYLGTKFNEPIRRTIGDLLQDGRSTNPLVIYEVLDTAKELGAFQPGTAPFDVVANAIARKP